MRTNIDTIVIHIQWEGPFSSEEVATLHGATDFGVYQIYGPHPIYGDVQLLYIGLASEQKFGKRIPWHDGWIHGTRDFKKVEIYVGRISDGDIPDNEAWTNVIKWAERLLIYAHYPTYNKKKDLASLEQELRNVHVLNWGQHRDLLPEVSGARWTSLYEDIPGYHAYSNLEMGKPGAPDADGEPGFPE